MIESFSWHSDLMREVVVLAALSVSVNSATSSRSRAVKLPVENNMGRGRNLSHILEEKKNFFIGGEFHCLISARKLLFLKKNFVMQVSPKPTATLSQELREDTLLNVKNNSGEKTISLKTV